MSFIDAIILGIVEGLSEFLPISSTGHLILASRLLSLEQTEFLKTFEVVIQLGAILSVVVLYWRRLFFEWETMKRIALALVPSVIIGGIFYSSIKKLFESEATVVAALFLGGIAIIAFELLHKEREDATDDISVIPYKTALFVGMFQALSVIPGVSRAGATILGGLFLGMKRRAIVEFSFLLAVPTMIAASAIDLTKNAGGIAESEWLLLAAGFAVSFVVAILAIKFLLRFVESHTFIPFGAYRIVVAVLFFIFVI